MVERANLRRPAELVDDVQPVRRRRDRRHADEAGFDRVLPFGNDRSSAVSCQDRRSRRAQSGRAARRASETRNKSSWPPKSTCTMRSLKSRELLPLAVRCAQEVGELAAVAVLHRGQHAARRVVDVELNLGDPRQVLAHLVAVVCWDWCRARDNRPADRSRDPPPAARRARDAACSRSRCCRASRRRRRPAVPEFTCGTTSNTSRPVSVE